MKRPKRQATSHGRYDPVQFSHSDLRNVHGDEDDEVSQGFCDLFYRWIESQTRLPSLILYAYLYWYLLLIISFGYNNMTSDAWIAGNIHL